MKKKPIVSLFDMSEIALSANSVYNKSKRYTIDYWNSDGIWHCTKYRASKAKAIKEFDAWLTKLSWDFEKLKEREGI